MFPNGLEAFGSFGVMESRVVEKVTLVVEKGGGRESCLDGLGKVRASHQILVHGARCAAAFIDGPNHEALAPAHIAG